MNKKRFLLTALIVLSFFALTSVALASSQKAVAGGTLVETVRQSTRREM